MSDLTQISGVIQNDGNPIPDHGPALACTFGLWIEVDEMEADLCFQRKEAMDSLWMEAEYGYRSDSVFSQARGSVKEACRRLFKAHIRKWRRYESPGRLITPALLSATDFRAAIEEVRLEIERNQRTAASIDTEIISVARELKLNPEPKGDSPTNWIAKCPGGKHWITIAPTSNQFGCDWCKVKGGPEELRSFAERRHL